MELGSEFWDAPLRERREPLPDENTRFVLSGRTALELVARDLIAERGIRSACLPAYCCDSMIAPFHKLGLELRFYDVIPTEDGVCRLLPENHGCDAVLLLDYFGYAQPETAALAEREHTRGVAVILDRVQSFYSVSESVNYADYTVMSWRKWFFSCAAAAEKRNGTWLTPAANRICPDYAALRRKAAMRKAAYIRSGEGDKKLFLDGFAQAELLLEAHSSGCAAEGESVEALRRVDVPFVRQRRRENASALYEGLKELRPYGVRPLFPAFNEEDVPLFVPVLVPPECRDALRCYLISKQIYCPIHWQDSKTGGGTDCYQQELSLLCDQRYSLEDVERQLRVIKEFFFRDA